MFDTKVSVMSFAADSDDQSRYSWQHRRWVWARVKYTGKHSIFATNGVSAAGVVFTICRLGDITPHRLLRWHGTDYIITSAVQQSAVQAELTAVAVQLQACTVTRPTIGTDEVTGRMRNTQRHLADFPAVLTEKYQRNQQEQPQTVVTTTRILVTPKMIALAPSDIVTIEDDGYVVQTVYDLGQYLNEYEILSTKEV